MLNYLSAEILPSIGAADVRLGDDENAVMEALGTPVAKDSLRLGSFKLVYDSVVVWLDKNSKVDQIRVFDKYKGSTSDGVKIGITKAELQRLWGWDLAYHEDGYWEFINRTGTLFNFENDEHGESRISEIFITI